MKAIKEGQEWLAARKIKSFYNMIEGLNFVSGARALFQTAGIGKLAPNILLIGYKSDWQISDTNTLHSYFKVMK